MINSGNTPGQHWNTPPPGQEGSSSHEMAVPSGDRFGFLRHALLFAGAVVVVVAILNSLLPSSIEIQRENGLLENLSVVLWAASAILAFWGSVRRDDWRVRMFAFWTGWVAVLAGLRELDLHILLNPAHLGSLGVRYRIDWWLNGEINPLIKLGWLVVLFVAVAPFVVPLWKLRRYLFQALVRGGSAVGMLALSTGFLFMGIVMDDLLRPVQFADPDLKQLIEETCELIGAALFAGSALIQWRRTAGERVRAVQPA